MSGGYDTTVRLHDIRKNTQVRLTYFTPALPICVFNRVLRWTTVPLTFTLLLPHNSQVRLLAGHELGVSKVLFNHFGNLIFSGSKDCKIKVRIPTRPVAPQLLVHVCVPDSDLFRFLLSTALHTPCSCISWTGRSGT